MHAFIVFAAAIAILAQAASSSLVSIPLHRRSATSFTNTDLTYDDGLVRRLDQLIGQLRHIESSNNNLANLN
jgi:hypothetical protein